MLTHSAECLVNNSVLAAWIERFPNYCHHCRATGYVSLGKAVMGDERKIIQDAATGASKMQVTILDGADMAVGCMRCLASGLCPRCRFSDFRNDRPCAGCKFSLNHSDDLMPDNDCVCSVVTVQEKIVYVPKKRK